MSRKPFKIVALIGTLLATADLQAADYATGFMLNTDASYNDNVRLQQNDKTSVRKFDLSPRLTLSATTEQDKIQLDSQFDFNRYDKSEFNSDDQNIALAMSHQFETSTLGLNANYLHNSTVTNELLTTGRIGNKADRAEQYSVSPNWTYQLGETNLLQLNGTYTTQNYASSLYTGYKDIESELDWVHVLSERTKLITSAVYSDYHSDDTAFNVFAFGPIDESTAASISGRQSYSARTKSSGAQLGLDYQWSEQSLIKVRLGRSRARTEYPVKDLTHNCTKALYLQLASSPDTTSNIICGNLPSNSGPQSNAELDWTWSNERQQFSLRTSKAIQPTSNGYAVDATQVSTNWSYNLSELDTLSIALSLVRNRAIDTKNTLQNTSIADRDYGAATLQYQRQLSENWYVNAGYHFAEQKYTQVDYQASAREYTLGIRYQPQQWYWSR